ncbi:hypothetical protein BOTBODRAFT_38559 [Botryobasidium botryosum FD-172 SS1]|uniref:Uncharacterized protein n=1 Tax=Botryobasidium botryosum (strain FD-172 SS1) TaxID=930990 RepID=A0A067LZF8_BOTB1|nr:hypothetical protein BOTBODRAFT_38559 [Botryobasidium botryosum FD-172 SS1]
MARSREYFCCCIPARFGVFVLSILSLLGAGSVAGLLWYILVQNGRADTVDFDGTQKTTFIVVAVFYTIFALVSLFGFIGAVARKKALVSIYSTVLWICLLLNVIAGAMVIYAITRRSDAGVAACKNRIGSDNASLCDASTGTKIGVIVSFVIQLLIQLYCCIIVARYVRQLDNEDAYSTRSAAKYANVVPTGGSTYYPPPAHSAHTELLGAKAEDYEFAAPHSSFGAGK